MFRPRLRVKKMEETAEETGDNSTALPRLGREWHFITPDTHILMADNIFKHITDVEIKKRYEL